MKPIYISILFGLLYAATFYIEKSGSSNIPCGGSINNACFTFFQACSQRISGEEYIYYIIYLFSFFF
jgi:hypothetical protein